MTRGTFLKSLFGVLIAPKSIIEISKMANPEQKCLFDVEKINGEIHRLKTRDRVLRIDKNQRQGYFIDEKNGSEFRFSHNSMWVINRNYAYNYTNA